MWGKSSGISGDKWKNARVLKTRVPDFSAQVIDRSLRTLDSDSQKNLKAIAPPAAPCLNTESWVWRIWRIRHCSYLYFQKMCCPKYLIWTATLLCIYEFMVLELHSWVFAYKRFSVTSWYREALLMDVVGENLGLRWHLQPYIRFNISFIYFFIYTDLK